MIFHNLRPGDKLPDTSIQIVHRYTSHMPCLSTCSSSQFICANCSHSRITQTRVARATAQDCTHWCPKQIPSSTRHVLFLAADTDHQHKLTLTYLTYLPVVLSLTVSLVQDPCADPRRSGGSTEIPPTGYEPRMMESDDFEPR